MQTSGSIVPREGEAMFGNGNASTTHSLSSPALATVLRPVRVIQYAAASRLNHCCLWNTGSPGPGYANQATPRLRCAGAPKL